MEGDSGQMLMGGKTAIVTGSARGLGKAVAMKLASLGANIVLNDINSSESLDDTAKEFKKAGFKYHCGKRRCQEFRRC
jgi:3-oxoacyl-[acyl-carrier protein] reductase